MFAGSYANAQNKTVLSGYIKTSVGEGLEGVTIKASIGKYSAKSDSTGYYQLQLPATKIELTYTFIGYRSQTISFNFLNEKKIVQDLVLINRTTNLDDVIIKSNLENSNAVNINPTLLSLFPSVSGNFETILKTLPGVSPNNELSAQYGVRGGNFDENLVYINDIEIFRPLLVRSGQQEGLSFINPELVSNAQFSAGGFAARYGDKLSSVLDIKYLKPDSNSYSVSLGLMGSSATVKQMNKRETNYLLIGARQKSNQNILSTQDVKGSYNTQFLDFQLLNNYSLSKKWEVSFLGGYNTSKFNLVPEDKETKFGTIDQTLRYNVDYSGQEKDRYETVIGGLSFNFNPNLKTNVKWINSLFRITERESFDIEGSYIFDELIDGLDDSGEKIKVNRGIGSALDHARNELEATILSSEVRGSFQKAKSFFTAGVKFQRDKIYDQLNEYQLIDSAGYTLPNVPGFVFSDAVNSSHHVITNRISGFLQDEISLSSKVILTVGIRGNYNSFNNEFFISPRVTLVYHEKEKNVVYRFSAGSYNQANFYRELRKFDGSLFENSKAQRSLHFLTGTDYNFAALGTQLRFTAELYYKYLSRLTPYKIENLRIRYLADQQSKGYATGVDFSLSGAFVKALESTFRLSLMQTKEDIIGDYYVVKDANGNSTRIEPGYLKRPTDQRINFSIFFQDRLLNSPTYKIHLNLLVGSSLPTGPPQENRYNDSFKIPAYKRVDIGFSKDFMDKERAKRWSFMDRNFKAFILYAEVFNMLDINNTVSYLWLKDITNIQYAIPNYLTGRQINLKLIVKLKSGN